MEWYRRYTDRSRHPQLFKAGFLGSVAFDALCDVAAEFDLGGVIPKQYCDPAWLAARAMLDPAEFGADHLETDETPARYMARGLEQAAGAGLISTDDEGSWTIDGWDRRQPRVPLKSSDRVRKHRERHTKEKVETRETLVKRDGTQRNAVKRGETHIEREKESEREREKEREKGPVSATPDALRLNADALRDLADRRAPSTALRALPVAMAVVGQFRDRIDSEFRAQRGGDYAWTSADETAVGALLGKAGTAGEEEIHRRWAIGLRRPTFPRCNTVCDLSQHWNAYAKDTTPPPKDIARGTVTAESQATLHGPAGEHAF